MIKIRHKHIIIFLLFILLLLLLTISSCQKVECSSNTDCISSKPCITGKCINAKCVLSTQSNCCGNNVKDAIEDNKPGNKCTCSQDYGRCEGKPKIKVGSRTEDTKYLMYYCDAENQCILGVEPKNILPQNLLDTISTSFFKISSVVKYPKPFGINKDYFEFTLSLDDLNENLVLPIKLTKMKLFYISQYVRLEQLVATEDLEIELNGIGDQLNIGIKLNLGYRTQEIEESGSFRYSIDYTYTKKVSAGRAPDGTTIYKDEIVRATFNSPSKPVFFVRGE